MQNSLDIETQIQFSIKFIYDGVGWDGPAFVDHHQYHHQHRLQPQPFTHAQTATLGHKPSHSFPVFDIPLLTWTNVFSPWTEPPWIIWHDKPLVWLFGRLTLNRRHPSKLPYIRVHKLVPRNSRLVVCPQYFSFPFSLSRFIQESCRKTRETVKHTHFRQKGTNIKIWEEILLFLLLGPAVDWWKCVIAKRNDHDDVYLIIICMTVWCAVCSIREE